MVEGAQPAVALRLLESCVVGGPQAAMSLGLSTAADIYYRLGRALRRAGRLEEERTTYKIAVAGGVWALTNQRPGYRFSRPLLASPWHDTSLLAAHGWADVAAAVADLEASWERIRDEVLAALSSAPPGHVHERASNSRREERPTLTQLATRLPLENDDEGLHDRGEWRQLAFVRDGQQLVKAWSGALPATEALIRRIARTGEPSAPLGADLPRGAAEVSVLAPRTHLVAHCGPTNHRLRLHLPLHVPPGDQARMRVGDSAPRAWVAGKVTILDDSFEHEVWNDAHDEHRVLLLIDVWHPELTPAERDEVRRDMGGAQTRWDAASTLH